MAEPGRSSSRLQEVFRDPAANQDPTIFIVVPGVGTLPPQQWAGDRGGNWLRDQQLVYSFDYDPLSDGILVWQRVFDAGNALLDGIRSLTEVAEYAGSPIVLVAHSLGGIILKRAICFAHKQQQTWEDLLERIAGVILLSCPHSRDEGDQWQKVARITKTFSKARKKYTLPPDLIHNLVEDCKCFENEFSDAKPVIAIHEQSETSTGKAPWHKEILVGESFAHPSVKDLVKLGMECGHNQTCCLRSDRNVSSVMADFLTRVVQKTRREFGFRSLSGPYKIPPALENSTVASESEFASDIGSDSRRRMMRPSVASASSNLSPVGRSVRTLDTITSTSSSGIPRASLMGALPMKKDPQIPCFAMPYKDNPSFHGRRSILRNLAQALLPQRAPNNDSAWPRSFALSGPGGLGKSQVAAKFVYQEKATYDAIFWIHSDSIGKLRLSFARIAVALGLVEEDSTDAQDEVSTRDLVLGWLARPLKSHRENRRTEEASWLVIFDNADNLDILTDFWPRGSGSILITSRVPLQTLSHFSNGTGIDMPPFEPDETEAFLLSITKRHDFPEDRASASDVAKRLDHIPLAVAQMAGAIVRKDITFIEFLREYENPESRDSLLRQPGSKRVGQDYEHDLLSVWGFDKLRYGADLLDILAFLDPDGIPEDILLQDTHVELEMERFPRSHAEYTQAREELQVSSLITRDRSAKKLVIHRLIQDTVRASMSSARYSQVFVSTLQLISGVWPYEEAFGFIKDETRRWRQCNELYRHVMFLIKLAAGLDPPSKFTMAHLQPPKLILETAWLSVMRADYVNTLALIGMAETLCKPLESDHEGLSRHSRAANEEFKRQLRMFSFHRAAFAHHTNQPHMSLSNAQHFVRSLEAQNGGAQDEPLGYALNELGVSYLQNDNADEAERCLQRSTAIFEASLDTSANTRSMPLINLGFVFWLQGRLREASAVFESTLTGRESEYGPDDTKSFALGKLLLGYGNVKAAQGQHDASLKLHERCLIQYRATVGNNHHRTGDGCVHVAEHYIRLKRYNEALELLDQASKIYSAPLSQSFFNPENARVCYKRWKVLRLLGRGGEASKSAAAALKLYRTINPSDSRGIDELSSADFDRSIMFWSR